MSKTTTNLGLYEKESTDGADTFNIQTMLNDNWEKIDAVTGPASELNEGVVKIGSGIDVDENGVISVPTVTVPVSSVNTKTGAVVLVPSDIGATAQTDFVSHQADYVRQPGYAVATGAANTYVASLNPAPTSYVDGMGIAIKISATNTGASTVNVSALGVKALKDPSGSDFAAGSLLVNKIYSFKYDSVSGTFIQQGRGGDANLVTGNIRKGVVIYGVPGKSTVVDTSDCSVTSTGQMLSGISAYGSDGNKFTGTMPLRGSEVYPGWRQGEVSLASSSGRVHLRIPLGAYLTGAPEQGGQLGVYCDGPDFTSANILSGKSIFGLTGTASNIKSIQRGTGNMVNTTSLNIAISSVDLSKAVVLLSYAGAETTPAYRAIKAKLTSSTNINLSMANAINNNNYFSYQVIEFENVKSLQRGDFSLLSSPGPLSVSVTSVNPSKCMLVHSHSIAINTSQYETIGSTLTDATTITFILVDRANLEYKIHWQLIEFN